MNTMYIVKPNCFNRHIYRETYLAVQMLLLVLINENRVNNHSKIMDMNHPYLSEFPREIKKSRAGTKIFIMELKILIG